MAKIPEVGDSVLTHDEDDNPLTLTIDRVSHMHTTDESFTVVAEGERMKVRWSAQHDIWLDTGETPE